MTDNKLYIYLISQDTNGDYDTYQSAVVVAPDKATAKQMHPNGNILDHKYWELPNDNKNWAFKPEDIQVTLIGTAQGVGKGVICANNIGSNSRL